MSSGGLILPENVAAERAAKEQEKIAEAAKAGTHSQLIVPYEQSQEVKTLLPDAEEAEKHLAKLVDKGEMGLVALMLQPSFLALMNNYVSGLTPQFIHTIVQADRNTLVRAVQQIAQDRIMKSKIGREKVDENTYGIAFNDFVATAQQVPPPNVSATLVKPALTEEPPAPESQEETPTA